MGRSSFFYGYLSSLKVLRRSSQKNCSRVLSALQKKSLRVKIPSAYSPKKKIIINSLMLGFSSLFIRQPTPYGISYFHLFLRARGYGKSIMCGSLGDFPKDAAVSCLVSDQIPFNLLSICSRMCLIHDLPTFYMQPGFFLQTNHMQPGFLLKVVICPLSICSPDSFFKQIICSPDSFLKL